MKIERSRAEFFSSTALVFRKVGSKGFLSRGQHHGLGSEQSRQQEGGLKGQTEDPPPPRRFWTFLTPSLLGTRGEGETKNAGAGRATQPQQGAAEAETEAAGLGTPWSCGFRTNLTVSPLTPRANH